MRASRRPPGREGPSVMGIDRLFSQTVCINLDRRPDRRRRMEDRFARQGMRGVRKNGSPPSMASACRCPDACGRGRRGRTAASGVTSRRSPMRRPTGPRACSSSRTTSSWRPTSSRASSGRSPSCPRTGRSCTSGVPPPRLPCRSASRLARATHTLSTLAYAVRRPFFGELLAFDASSPEAIDTRLARLQARHVFHCLRPNLAWQDCDYSDIQGTVTNPLVHQGVARHRGHLRRRDVRPDGARDPRLRPRLAGG